MARRLIAGVGAVAALAAACSGRGGESQSPIPRALPLPTAGIAGQPVAVYPVTMLLAEETLGWTEPLSPRRTALHRVDSVILETLTSRSPEVPWVGPDVMRRGASQAPGMLADPDQLATSLLRQPSIVQLPDPLRPQMRSLTALAGARFALVPASLFYYDRADSADGRARAELTMVLADVRTGAIGWRTVLEGRGDDPWTALADALRSLTPGLP